jgi:formate dehydrogenase subunit beta
LIKLQQASREAVLVISIDCPGTYDVNDYATLAEKTANAGLDLLSGLRQGAPAPHAGFSFRAACRMCEQPLPDQADVRIKIVGVPGDAELRIIGPDSFMSELGLQPMDNVGAVDGSAEQRLVEARIVERDRLLAEFHDRVRDLSGLIEEFSTCIRCLNCMTACPLCYCKECIFRTETFNHRPADYQRWVNRKGAVKLPADTLLFHLTRLNHMVVSCVGCGLCESACPNDLPVARVFRAVGRRVQGLFGYVPGRDLMEEIPIATFREDELE